jgi:hypothetical protein
MRSRRNHLGTGFEVWTGEHTWFWFVIRPDGNGGTFGAAATEAVAVREACLSIEQMSAHRRAGAAELLVTAKSAPLLLSRYHSFTLAGWEGSLANLERYLNSVCQTVT